METSEEDEHDWFDDLIEEQQKSVIRGLEQADRGEGIPHKEALIRLGLSRESGSANTLLPQL